MKKEQKVFEVYGIKKSGTEELRGVFQFMFEAVRYAEEIRTQYAETFVKVEVF